MTDHLHIKPVWRRAILPLAIVAVAVGAAVMLKNVRSDEAFTAPPPVPVEVFEATFEPRFDVREQYAGRIEPRRSSTVGFEIPGQVIALRADDGDVVAKGDVMADLDTQRLRIRRDELTAQRAATQARLDLAKVTAERRKTLLERGHISAQTYDEARFDVDGLQAEIDGINAALRSVETDIADGVLRAPFDAVVAQRYVDEGVVVSAGQPIFRLHEDGAYEARIGVPVTRKARLVEGSEQTLLVNGRQITGTIASVVPDLDPGTRTVTAIVTINDNGVVANDLVRLAFSDAIDKQGVWVPLSALTEGVRGLWSIYIADQGKAWRKDVEVLHTEADRVFVTGTLEPDDMIIVSGAHRLVPGQAVEARPVEMLFADQTR